MQHEEIPHSTGMDAWDGELGPTTALTPAREITLTAFYQREFLHRDSASMARFANMFSL